MAAMLGNDRNVIRSQKLFMSGASIENEINFLQELNPRNIFPFQAFSYAL